jgi:hypothetical protein
MSAPASNAFRSLSTRSISGKNVPGTSVTSRFRPTPVSGRIAFFCSRRPCLAESHFLDGTFLRQSFLLRILPTIFTHLLMLYYFTATRQGLPDFSWYTHTQTGKINIPMTIKYVYQTVTKLPNGHKIYQHLPSQDPPKCAQIFGLKIYHLATL